MRSLNQWNAILMSVSARIVARGLWAGQLRRMITAAVTTINAAGFVLISAACGQVPVAGESDTVSDKGGTPSNPAEASTDDSMNRSIARPDDRPTARVTGVVLNDGEVFTGAIVKAWYMGWSGRGWGEFATGESTSNAKGEFTLTMPRRRLSGIRFYARTPDGSRTASFSIDPGGGAGEARSRYLMADPGRISDVRLELVPAFSRKVHVVDSAGAPVSGAHLLAVSRFGWRFAATQTNAAGAVTVWVPQEYAECQLLAFKSGFGLDYVPYRDRRQVDVDSNNVEPVRMKLTTPPSLLVKILDAHSRQRLPDVRITVSIPNKPGGRAARAHTSGFGISSASDRDGRMKIDWLPGWAANKTVRIWGARAGYAHGEASIVVGTRGNLVTVEMRPYVRLHGRVVHADGKPGAGIVVESANVSVHHRDRTTADKDGRFEFHVPHDTASIVSVVDPTWATVPWLNSAKSEATSVDVPDVVLQPAQRLYGRVAHGDRPIANQEISLILFGPPSGGGKWPDRNPQHDGVRASRSTWTDENGRYEFRVGPGTYLIKGPKRIESYDDVLFQRAPGYQGINITRHEESRRHDIHPTLWEGP